MAAAVWLHGCGNSLNKELAQAETKTGYGLSAEPTVKLPREAEALTAVATPGSNAYKIGPQDTIEIAVFKVPDLSRTVQVADSGTVNLPLIGDVVAAGKTAQQLERDLVKKYGGKYLQSPQVTVSVKEYNSQRVTIEGAVKKPGVYPIRGKASLLQFIATAEGLDPNAEFDSGGVQDDGRQEIGRQIRSCLDPQRRHARSRHSIRRHDHCQLVGDQGDVQQHPEGAAHRWRVRDAVAGKPAPICLE